MQRFVSFFSVVLLTGLLSGAFAQGLNVPNGASQCETAGVNSRSTGWNTACKSVQVTGEVISDVSFVVKTAQIQLDPQALRPDHSFTIRIPVRNTSGRAIMVSDASDPTVAVNFPGFLVVTPPSDKVLGDNDTWYFDYEVSIGNAQAVQDAVDANAGAPVSFWLTLEAEGVLANVGVQD